MTTQFSDKALGIVEASECIYEMYVQEVQAWTGPTPFMTFHDAFHAAFHAAVSMQMLSLLSL